jgi:hypothetical protein
MGSGGDPVMRCNLATMLTAVNTKLAVGLNMWISPPGRRYILTCSDHANMVRDMTRSLARQVVDEIEAFLDKTGMPYTTFGKLYNGDPSLVARLRKGRSPNADTIDGMRRFMSEYKPPKRSPRPRKRGNGLAAVAA